MRVLISQVKLNDNYAFHSSLWHDFFSVFCVLLFCHFGEFLYVIIIIIIIIIIIMMMMMMKVY